MPLGPEQLRDWINRRGFTQSEAADYLRLNAPLVSKIMAGKYNPGLRYAIYIERLTGIPVEAWANGLDNFEMPEPEIAGKRRVAKG